MLAKKFNLDKRDIGYFRDHYYCQNHSREQIAEALIKKLPRLKVNKSYRYESYLRRLAFLSKITNQEWQELIKEY